MGYYESLYLNEKMVLNAAAYLFKGVDIESEEKKQSSTNTQANAEIGISFLKGLLGKANLGIEGASASINEVNTVRRYTLGGLHMAVLDELTSRKELSEPNKNKDQEGTYYKVKAILQPVDIFQLVETLQTSAPLIVQILKHFGPTFGMKKTTIEEFLKYDKPIIQIIEAIEQDYLKSNQLEMMLCDPKTGNPFGVVDLDVTDYDPRAIKAKLTDGQFTVIGKITKRIGEDQKLSLVQRTFLSYVMSVLEKLVSVNSDSSILDNYKNSIDSATPFVEKFCRLSIDGPAYRMTALSVCV